MLISLFSALSEALKADHGFNVESKAIRDLIEIMGDYNVTTRRAFLQFITGSPKLPIGGMISTEPSSIFIEFDIHRFPWTKSAAYCRSKAS